MFRSLLIAVAAVAVLIVSTPAAAQESSLWSATLTVGEIEYSSGSTAVGYSGLSSVQAGELSDPDFDFRGTTHTLWYFTQSTSGAGAGSVSLAFSPPLDGQDLDSLTFTADGHRLPGSDRFATYDVGGGDNQGVQIAWRDPGFRWTEGQRIAVGLTVPASVPALPLAAAGLLALLLGGGAYRRVAGRS